jgi:tetratricopeptide (TPR) repeat protein
MTQSQEVTPLVTATQIDALWDFGDPAETERRFLAHLPAAKMRAESDPAAAAMGVELLTQIARTRGLQRRFDEAHLTLDEAEAAAKSVDPHKWPRTRLRIDLERGRVLNSSKQVDAARPHFLAAFALGCDAEEDGLAVDAAHMVAIIEIGQASLDWNLKALELARGSTQPAAQKWVGSLTNNMGWSFHDLGEHAKALGCFEENAAWHAERGQTKQRVIARWSIARQLRALGRVEEALAAQVALAAEKSEPEGYTEEELGECLQALGRPAEAAPHFASAFALLGTDPWFVANEAPRLARLGELGGVQA